MALFDRLCGASSWGEDPTSRADPAASCDDLVADLHSLLATRSALPAGRFAAHAATVLDWGVPDLGALDVRAGDDRATAARAVQVAIERFEPRLRAVRVSVEPSTAGPLRANLRIVAEPRHAPGGTPVELALELPAAAATPMPGVG